MPNQVKPILDGCRTVSPHLTVRGAAEAIEFYKKAFSAKELHRAPGPDGNSLLHAEIQIGDSRIYLNDEFPGVCGSTQALGGSPVVIHL